MSYIVEVAARWTKSLKFTLSIAAHRGGLAKNHIWLVATQKKRIGEQINHFLNMCPKPWANGQKMKDKIFSDGKSRGPLLARAALKTNIQKTWRTTMSCRLVSPNLQSIIKRALRTLGRNIRKMLSDCRGECDLKTNETEENREVILTRRKKRL